MKNFHIEYPDEGLREALIDKINNLTKPKGSSVSYTHLTLPTSNHV